MAPQWLILPSFTVVDTSQDKRLSGTRLESQVCSYRRPPRMSTSLSDSPRQHTASFNTLQDNARSNLQERLATSHPASTRLSGHTALAQERCLHQLWLPDTIRDCMPAIYIQLYACLQVSHTGLLVQTSFSLSSRPLDVA